MEPLLFWRETHPQLGYLSNWYECPFHTGDGTEEFANAEQYMMLHKALLFQDRAKAEAIMREASPANMQKLGRQVANYDGKVWVANRERIVEEAVWHKFFHSHDPDMKGLLLKTGNAELVEASPYDRIWGVGYGEEDALARRDDWGLNLLGKCLMRARVRLVAGEGNETKQDIKDDQ